MIKLDHSLKLLIMKLPVVLVEVGIQFFQIITKDLDSCFQNPESKSTRKPQILNFKIFSL
jgi:hypothetical protein